VNPVNGAIAAIDTSGMMYVRGAAFTSNPNSAYGLGNFKITGVRWSPDGKLLAFRVERPDARDGRYSFVDTISDGIWVVDVASGYSRHIFRNEYRAGNDNRIAYDFIWANDSKTVVIWIKPDRREFILVSSDTDLDR
jgi:Tol biopolymer transport system component